MPQWRIEGADRTTGVDCQETIDADFERQAIRVASKTMMIERVTLVTAPSAKFAVGIRLSVGVLALLAATYWLVARMEGESSRSLAPAVAVATDAPVRDLAQAVAVSPAARRQADGQLSVSCSRAAKIMFEADGNTVPPEQYDAYLDRLLAIYGDSRERRSAQILSAKNFCASKGKPVTAFRLMSDFVVMAESTPAMQRYSFEDTFATCVVTATR